MSSSFDQHRYQVRFDWGVAGLSRLAPADLVVVVDVLGAGTAASDALEAGSPLAHAALDQRFPDAAAVVRAAVDAGSGVLLGSLRTARAVAEAVAAVQRARGERTSVSLIAVGEATPAGGIRFAVEDELGAGAIIDALAAFGIDHTSPEAAAACAAFQGLRPAVRHLLTAAGSGQQLIADGARDDAIAAAMVDAASAAPRLIDGTFSAAAISGE
ncbi:2-phosphosulfolactate phosphatase [Microbacterium aurantiacum]|uniref:Probable 2-phosphosulfolactate phosphatase n=1 Tax=Microbacterium aurantiacum TaxID=162393 RepID=A0AAJ2HBE9_9MICO|nr:2-phosphosulfolactate phosphatase [Microbacterium aurantiacum]MDS0244470.1 2-phosphosulfolactate phosphatase [Microbacterium aurantiacum]